MKFMVKDIDAVVAAAKQRGATIITTGGAPVTLASGLKAVFMRDPDGYIVEAIAGRVRLRWTSLATSWVR